MVVLVPPIVTYSVDLLHAPMVPFVLAAAGVTVPVVLATATMDVLVNVELLVLHIATPTARWTVVNLVTDVPVVVTPTALVRVEAIVPVLSLLA